MSKPKIDIQPSQIPSEHEKPEEPIYLKDDPLYFAKRPPLKSRAFIPPPTPDQKIECTRTKEIPEIQVDRIENVPAVKEEGIKFTIESLGKQLGLGNYEYDLIQFWLLDMLTDCAWKAQEVSHFELEEQKVVLNWITAIFKIIADPILNISRKNFLKLFKDVLLQSYKSISLKFQFPGVELLYELSKKYFVEEEDVDFETDGEDFDVDEEEESESSSSSSNESLSTLSTQNLDRMVIFPEFNIKEHIDRLKKNNPLANDYHCYSETNPRSTKLDENPEEQSRYSANDYLDLLDEDISFYKPDIGTPTRFRSTLQLDDIYKTPYICKCLVPEDSSESVCDIFKSKPKTGEDFIDSKNKSEEEEVIVKDEEEIMTTLTKSSSLLLQENLSAYMKNMSASAQILNYLVKGNFPNPCMKGVRPVEIFTIPEPDDCEESALTEEELEKIKERELMNEWAYFLMMEQRGWDMDDPKIGWVPWHSFLEKEKGSLEDFIRAEVEVESIQSSKSNKNSLEEFDVDRSKNFKILQAIVDFVFEYFYENFHFTLIKLAFRSTPFTITQEINTKWPTPKVIKQEFKRPKPAKEKKKKKKKDKKKRSKSKSSKKSKKKKKSDKKSKKSKKEKKKKKEKKPKMSKAELARLKKLKELEEEEWRKREENRVFMFPLADAASESLFMSIFENWVKKAAKGKKKKKGKKGKKDGKGKKKK